MRLFRCSKCRMLEKEIEYLKKLVDQLLIKGGTGPVDEKPFDIDSALNIEKPKDKDGKEEAVELYGD